MVYNYVWIRNADIRGIFCVAFLKIHTKSDYNCSYQHYSHWVYAFYECRLHCTKSVVLLNIIGFLIFFSQGAFNMTMIVMLNNTIEYDEVRFHERHDSIISAVRSFATKLASAVDQAVVALILIISNIYAISQKISGLEIKAGTGELTSENVIVQADKFIQTADAGQRFILRLGIVAVPVISIGAAYILIKRKYIIDERKYEELVAEIKSTNKK